MSVDEKRSISNNKDCPWCGLKFPLIGKELKISTSLDNENTSTLLFSGGWRLPDDENKGIYSYSNINYNNTPGYKLEVVPDFDSLTWIGTPPYCSYNSRTDCISGNNSWDDLKKRHDPNYLYPKQWAGYYDNGTLGQEKDEPGIYINSNCPNKCLHGRLALCTTSEQMIPESCPGYTGINSFSEKKPSVIPKDISKGDYTVNANKLYPRGKGECFYPSDIITNDDDLKNLKTLVKDKKFPKELADELITNYCYKTVTTDCGNDIDGKPIKSCPKYIQELASNSLSSPCSDWINDYGSTDENKKKLDSNAIAWCNSNSDSAACDCLKCNVLNEDKGIRNYYNAVTQKLKETNTINVPNHCWFEPCKTNSYAITPQYIPSTDICPVNSIICNAIINAPNVNQSYIDSNKQTLSCKIDDSKSVNSNTNNTSENNTSSESSSSTGTSGSNLSSKSSILGSSSKSFISSTSLNYLMIAIPIFLILIVVFVIIYKKILLKKKVINTKK